MGECSDECMCIFVRSIYHSAAVAGDGKRWQCPNNVHVAWKEDVRAVGRIRMWVRARAGASGTRSL